MWRYAPYTFRIWLDLLPVLFFFGDFLRGRRKLQLYLAVKRGKFGLQLFQFIFFFPYLARYFLQLRNIPLQCLVFRLVLVNGGGYLLQCVQEVACGGHRVSHRQMPVVVGVLVVSFNHETVVGELQSLFEYPFADHLYREAVKLSDLCVKPARSGALGYLLQTLTENLLVGGIHSVHLYHIKAVAFLVDLHHRKKAVPVLRHGINESRVVAQLTYLRLQLELRITSALVERLAFSFERCDTLFKFSLVQQVGVAGEQRHILRKVHARFLVHCPLVDGTRPHSTAFELADESLLAVQEVELVAVQ